MCKVQKTSSLHKHRSQSAETPHKITSNRAQSAKAQHKGTARAHRADHCTSETHETHRESRANSTWILRRARQHIAHSTQPAPMAKKGRARKKNRAETTFSNFNLDFSKKLFQFFQPPLHVFVTALLLFFKSRFWFSNSGSLFQSSVSIFPTSASRFVESSAFFF